MIRNLILILTATIAFQASANKMKAGLICTEDRLPDGDLQEFDLRPTLGEIGKYEVVYRLQRGSILDGVTAPMTEKILIRDLTCIFGRKTPGIVNCSVVDRNGNVTAYFNAKHMVETRMTTINSDENVYRFSSISLSSDELKAHFQEDGYPDELTKTGSLSFDFDHVACGYK